MNQQLASSTKTAETNRQNGSVTSRQPAPHSTAIDYPLLQLQRGVGNQAVARIIQTKLEIRQPGDRYEQEADRVAELMMRMPAPQIQRKCSDVENEDLVQTKSLSMLPSGLLVQRKCAACMSGDGPCPKCREQETMQRKESGSTPVVTPGIAARIDALRGGGQVLPPSARAFFEPRFGYDFSRVRVHTGAQATETSRSVNARAFTIGRDIVFGAGQYAPDTGSGKLLLAHELTHVVQQSGHNSLGLSAKYKDGGSGGSLASKQNKLVAMLGDALIAHELVHENRQGSEMPSPNLTHSSVPIQNKLKSGTNAPAARAKDSMWSRTKQVSGLRPSLFGCKGGGGGAAAKTCDKNADCKDICDQANKDSSLNQGGGGVVCCHEKKCPCVFDLPEISYKRGDCAEYERIAELHEQRHLTDVECDSSKGLHRPPFKDQSAAVTSECAHRIETRDLLDEAIKTASDPCKTRMTDLRNLLDTWVKANCGSTGSGGDAGAGGG